MRQGARKSVDQLGWESPELKALHDLGIDHSVTFHSIIADLRDSQAPCGTDGVVPQMSAHLSGARSELIVSSPHYCLNNPSVIQEARRILLAPLWRALGRYKQLKPLLRLHRHVKGALERLF